MLEGGVIKYDIHWDIHIYKRLTPVRREIKEISN